MRKIDFIVAVLVNNGLLTEEEASALTNVVESHPTNALTSLLASFEMPHCCGDCDGKCDGECHEKKD